SPQPARGRCHGAHRPGPAGTSLGTRRWSTAVPAAGPQCPAAAFRAPALPSGVRALVSLPRSAARACGWAEHNAAVADVPGTRGRGNMRIRRCAVLMLEPRGEARFALDDLLAGGNGLRRTLRWLALAGHLDAPVEFDAAERELLGQASPTEWLDPDGLPEALAGAVPRLVAEGLLLEEAPADPAASDADARLRELCWWTPSAVAHRHGRWQGVDGARESERAGLLTVEGLESRFGPPPPHVAQTGTGPGAPRQPLPRTPDADFDRLLARRATCRNFDTARPLDRGRFATMLQRVFGARAHVDAGTGATFLKKGSPSGG